MMNFQKMLFAGHLGKDATIRVSSEKGKVIYHFTIAVHNSNKTHTEWFKCVYFSTAISAEQLNLNDYLLKGANVLVDGSFKTRKNTFKEKTQYITEFFVSDLQIIKKGKKEESQESAKPYSQDESSCLEEKQSEESVKVIPEDESPALEKSEESPKAIPKEESRSDISENSTTEFSEENPFASAFD